MLLNLIEEVIDAHKSATLKERPKSCVGKYIQSPCLGKDQDLSQFLSITTSLGGEIKRNSLLCMCLPPHLMRHLQHLELATAGGRVGRQLDHIAVQFETLCT